MSNDDKQANSDPLPYTQVDRAVKPKATLLAAMIKTSTQHALGSLVEFWDLNGDPREIEQLVCAGKRNVVLTRDEVRRRFRIASGADVDPDDLRSLGLLECVGEEFRVRGMSRYFAPVERRLQARAAAEAGGKARAESDRGPDGRFLAVTGGGAPAGLPAGPSGGPSAGVLAGVRVDAVQPTSSREASQKPPQRTAVSGQRTSSTDLVLVEVESTPPTREVFEHWRRATGKSRAVLDAKRRDLIGRRLAEGSTVEDLKAAIDGYAKSPWHNGENDRKRKFLGIELMLRDAAHVEAGMDMHTSVRPAASKFLDGQTLKNLYADPAERT